MYERNCYICNSTNSEILFKQENNDTYIKYVFAEQPKDLYWKICKDCSLIYRSPVLDNNEIDKLYENYDKNVVDQINPDEHFKKITSLPNSLSENWTKSKWIEECLVGNNKLETNADVLDVGCGGGTLLYSLQQIYTDIKMHGVELNKVYASIAKKNLKINLKQEKYKNNLFNKKFDFIINTKVLEHIIDPLPFLKYIFDDLKNNGMLFIEVPDISDMYYLPPSDERFFIPHIYFFSENTLARLLQKTGFSIIKSRVFKTHRNRNYLQIIAQKERIKMDQRYEKPPLTTINHIIDKIKKNMA